MHATHIAEEATVKTKLVCGMYIMRYIIKCKGTLVVKFFCESITATWNECLAEVTKT